MHLTSEQQAFKKTSREGDWKFYVNHLPLADSLRYYPTKRYIHPGDKKYGMRPLE
jgi:hypothetical protein